VFVCLYNYKGRNDSKLDIRYCMVVVMLKCFCVYFIFVGERMEAKKSGIIMVTLFRGCGTVRGEADCHSFCHPISNRKTIQ
jgi:hypothetical protein